MNKAPMVLTTQKAGVSEHTIFLLTQKFLTLSNNSLVPNFNFSSQSTAFQCQFLAYRKRKALLFKRMKFGTIGMCIIIIFLSWLQDWLPMKNRQFWSKGMSSRTCRRKLVSQLNIVLKIFNRLPKEINNKNNFLVRNFRDVLTPLLIFLG